MSKHFSIVQHPRDKKSHFDLFGHCFLQWLSFSWTEHLETDDWFNRRKQQKENVHQNLSFLSFILKIKKVWFSSATTKQTWIRLHDLVKNVAKPNQDCEFQLRDSLKMPKCWTVAITSSPRMNISRNRSMQWWKKELYRRLGNFWSEKFSPIFFNDKI